jgi:TolB-like protein
MAPSVAVLPFADMSPNKDQEYFADGMAEEILNSLTQVEGLRVSGRTSSFSFKGTRRKIAEIGRDLNVGTILEGSVRKAGGRIRVTAQLVKTADEFHLWSRTFDRDLFDVFAVQDEIARAVVEALRLRLLPGQTLAQGGTKNQEAYEQFLVARDLRAIRSQASVERAVQACERALALDPRYAQAWAELAVALTFLESSYDVRPSPERRRRIEQAEERAIELAPDLADTYLTRGERRLLSLRDWGGAQADLRRARELSPGSSGVMYLHGRMRLVLGQVGGAVEALEAATAADPISALAFIFLGQAYLSAGEATRAEAALTRALQIAPRSDSSRYYLIALLITRGRPVEALLVARQADVKWVRSTGIALALHDLRRTRESQAALEAMVATSAENASYQIAEIHAWRGEADLAFEWLERARLETDAGLNWIKTDPLLGKIRTDPRYTTLLRTLNLPVD